MVRAVIATPAPSPHFKARDWDALGRVELYALLLRRGYFALTGNTALRTGRLYGAYYAWPHAAEVPFDEFKHYVTREVRARWEAAGMPLVSVEPLPCAAYPQLEEDQLPIAYMLCRDGFYSRTSAEMKDKVLRHVYANWRRRDTTPFEAFREYVECVMRPLYAAEMRRRGRELTHAELALLQRGITTDPAVFSDAEAEALATLRCDTRDPVMLAIVLNQRFPNRVAPITPAYITAWELRTKGAETLGGLKRARPVPVCAEAEGGEVEAEEPDAKKARH